MSEVRNLLVKKPEIFVFPYNSVFIIRIDFFMASFRNL
jgi:hypothetical protein